MATIQHTTENLVGGTIRVTWANLTFTGTDVGTPVRAPDHIVKDVQVIGTFGVGGSVTLQGSLDAETTWATLNDVQGSALTFTSARLEKVQETAASVRPAVTAGDGTTSVTVVMVLSLGNVRS